MPIFSQWFQRFWATILQPISPLAEFALRLGVGLVIFVIVVRWLARQFPKSIKGEHFGRSLLKTFRSQNDEMVVCMTRQTLEDRHFADGQKVNLIFNNLDPIPVTIRKRNKTSNLDNGQLQIAVSVLNAADLTESKIDYVSLLGVAFGWKSLMLQSFDHPDMNVRLAWLLSFWSFIASTLAGILISHFHMLVPR